MATAKKAVNTTKKAPAPKSKKDVAAEKPVAAKGAKAKKDAGEAAPKVKKESAAQLFRDLIMEGKKTDDQIFAEVQKKFSLDDSKRGYVAWYRNDLSKKGENPPAPKEAK